MTAAGIDKSAEKSVCVCVYVWCTLLHGVKLGLSNSYNKTNEMH
jgi:hypothetical protein